MLTHQIFNAPLNMNRAYFRLREHFDIVQNTERYTSRLSPSPVEQFDASAARAAPSVQNFGTESVQNPRLTRLQTTLEAYAHAS
jgi:hypothetical protein